ncbi:hypothetical protein [Deinococcus ruber]|uniref:Uncharacterized protein n=1 Tax=Deinococcus ruber TaxID=1848197 RepID=A0A918F616_9DEIO|nr:hypothetical protein [Deinococcus ruber]GGR11595.1 hypothetical protein GCM10008957_25720 [Deinococcus ruber]
MSFGGVGVKRDATEAAYQAKLTAQQQYLDALIAGRGDLAQLRERAVDTALTYQRCAARDLLTSTPGGAV